MKQSLRLKSVPFGLKTFFPALLLSGRREWGGDVRSGDLMMAGNGVLDVYLRCVIKEYHAFRPRLKANDSL